MTPAFYERLAQLPEEQMTEFDTAAFTPKEKGHLMMHRIIFLNGGYAEDAMPRPKDVVEPLVLPEPAPEFVIESEPW